MSSRGSETNECGVVLNSLDVIVSTVCKLKFTHRDCYGLRTQLLQALQVVQYQMPSLGADLLCTIDFSVSLFD